MGVVYDHFMNVDEAMRAPVDVAAIELRVEEAKQKAADLSEAERKEWLKLAVTLVDLTTLEGSDTPEKVRELCQKAMEPVSGDASIPPVAAVCVYPNLVRTAVDELAGSGVGVASVAGGFPAGQTPLAARLLEIEAAVLDGADEIDVVYSRNLLLSGREDEAEAEIAAMREACGGARMKVILETGELKDCDLIRRASFRAMRAGADFIKTSTGMSLKAENATLPVTLVMMDAIREYDQLEARKVGIKPAGGIRTADEALQYLALTGNALGGLWMRKDLFRFGTSSLLGKLTEELRGVPSESSADAAY
jgi:deoxyribose-phosphate aldolase